MRGHLAQPSPAGSISRLRGIGRWHSGWIRGLIWIRELGMMPMEAPIFAAVLAMPTRAQNSAPSHRAYHFPSKSP